MTSWWVIPFIIIRCLLCLSSFFISNFILSYISIAIPAFLWMSFVGASPFTLSLRALCLSLYLSWISRMQHIIGSCFLIYPTALPFGEFSTFTFRWLIMYKVILQLFYILFSGYSVFQLFLFPCVYVFCFSVVVFYDFLPFLFF